MSQGKDLNDTLNEVWKVNRCVCVHVLSILVCVLINNYDGLRRSRIFCEFVPELLTVLFAPFSLMTLIFFLLFGFLSPHRSGVCSSLLCV